MKKPKTQKVTTLIESPFDKVKIMIGNKEIKVKPVLYIEHELYLN